MCYLSSGAVAWKGSHKKPIQNTAATTDDEITMEMNCDLHTLHFFKNGTLLPFVITDINIPVKFALMIYAAGESVQIVELVQDQAPLALPGPDEQKLPFTI